MLSQFPPRWLNETPLAVPLRYFASRVPAGNLVHLAPDSILYNFGNQLFGWGSFPQQQLVDFLQQPDHRSGSWLLIPESWQEPAQRLLADLGLSLLNRISLHHLQRNSPVAPQLLPSGYHFGRLEHYREEIGELFNRFEQEQEIVSVDFNPEQQFRGVNEYGQCWGLYLERRLVGKLDLLYQVGDCAWAGGLLLQPELRGSNIGLRFLLSLLQQSSLNVLELHTTGQLLPHYLSAGCRELTRFEWLQL